MYTSNRVYKTEPWSTAEIAKLANKGFVPIVRGISGFFAYYVVDSGDGVMASISMFESRAAAERSNKAAADWVGKNLASLLPNPPDITAGEVVVESSWTAKAARFRLPDAGTRAHVTDR